MHKDVELSCKSNMYIYSIHTVHEVISQQHSCQVYLSTNYNGMYTQTGATFILLVATVCNCWTELYQAFND